MGGELRTTVTLSKTLFTASALAVLLASCAKPAQPTGTAEATGAPSPAAVVSEVRVPTAPPQTPVPAAPTPLANVAASAPLASGTPPAATATVVPTATPANPHKLIPIRAATAAPKIVSVTMSQSTMHPGQTISGMVVTSSNVASVEVRIVTYSIDMQKTGVGRFAMAYTVPNIPVFLRGHYTMQVIARNSAGERDTRAIPITIR